MARFAAESALDGWNLDSLIAGMAKARIGLDVLGTRSLDVRSLFGRIRIRDFETML